MERLFDPPDKRPEHHPPADGPLAARMRPQTLDEFVGQEHLLGEGSALRRRARVGAPALDGPVRAAGHRQDHARAPRRRARRAPRSRSSSRRRGRARRGARGDRARPHRRQSAGAPTIFFLDEIHRFNKAQQDALLPGGRGGPRDADRRDDREPLLRGQQRAAHRAPRSTSCSALSAERHRGRCCGARSSAASVAQARGARRGDRVPRRPLGRRRPRALNALELAAATPAPATRSRSAARRGRDAAQGVRYDKARRPALRHISAWIKSTRGSDPDASLYYLAVMLEGGEDPRFIARRMIILASEDVGNADPQALQVAVAAAHAVEHVGHARGAVRAGPGGDLPVARAEVERRRRARSAPPASTSASTARSLRRPRCAPPPTRARRTSAAGSATTYPHDRPTT